MTTITNSAKCIKNNINNDDDAVYNTKQQFILVTNRNKFNNNSNSNRIIKKVKVIDVRNNESDQSNQIIDNTTYQGMLGNSKMKKIVSLCTHDPKQDIHASVSSPNDHDPKDDIDNICDMDVEDFTSTVPINECDGEDIDARIVDEENTTHPVEHVSNKNIDVKVDIVVSLIYNDSKDDTITNINKDKNSTLHVDMWDNNIKATTATIDKKSVDKHSKAVKEHEKKKVTRH